MIRKGLRQIGQAVPFQTKREILRNRPTLKWICFLSYGVAKGTVEIGKYVHREIANLKDSPMIVIKILGNECQLPANELAGMFAAKWGGL